MELNKKFLDRTCGSKIKHIQDRPGHDTRYALNSNKIIDQLKWSKKFKFNDGIKKTFKWYINNLDYFKKFKKKDILKRIGKND